MMTTRDSFVFGPAEGHKHTHTVIFLHGRDSEAHEFANELFESEASADILRTVSTQPREGQLLTLPNLFPTIRWVFPAASIIPCQRFDAPMSQWFDMWSVEKPNERSELQEEGLKNSITMVQSVVAQELAHSSMARSRMFLAGISQGFATAISTFLADKEAGFAGLVGLCSWLPFANDEPAATLATLRRLTATDEGHDNGSTIMNKSQLATPIFLGHSIDDEVVPIENGRQMYKALRTLFGDESARVQWREYGNGGHWLNEPLGVDDMATFMTKHMSN